MKKEMEMAQSIKTDYENHVEIQVKKKMFTVKRNGVDGISRGNCNSCTRSTYMQDGNYSFR